MLVLTNNGMASGACFLRRCDRLPSRLDDQGQGAPHCNDAQPTMATSFGMLDDTPPLHGALHPLHGSLPMGT